MPVPFAFINIPPADELEASQNFEQLFGTIWFEPILENSWVTEEKAPARYHRNGLEDVRLTGFIKGGESGKQAFQLPEFFRPLHEVRRAISAAGPSFGMLLIEPNGQVTPFAVEAKNGIYLDCSFRAEQ